MPVLIGYFRVTWHLDYKTVDAFHSTKPFEIWKQEQVVQKFPGKSFQKFTKLLNFRNVNHSTENSRNSERAKLNRKKTSGKTLSKIWGYFTRLSCVLEILENAVLFVTGNWTKILNRTFWLNGKYPVYTAFQGVKHTTFLWSLWWLDCLRVLYLLKSTSRYTVLHPSVDGTVSNIRQRVDSPLDAVDTIC